MGPPERRSWPLSQAAISLALGPEEQRPYLPEKAVKAEIAETGALPVPLHIRILLTRLMKQMGYSKGYLYPHNYPGGWVAQEYLPKKIGKTFF